MYFIEDENFAKQLQNEYQAYENFRYLKEETEKENSNPVDSQLEYIDPTPSIHDLFMRFNKKFFWNALGMVEVVWSSRMTKCAGVCSFEGGRGLCKIALSAPLLSLRPRKDLVETLLHEMIHAYLFVTHNYKDREDHGPEFHKHMYRINREAGTKITVYHTFFDEVEYYQRHIWRCSGPCQKKKPYFGFVRRAINRAPGPSDTWWSDHQRECNGTFIKISEPEKKPKTRKKVVVVKTGEKNKDIRDYFTKKGTLNNSNIKTLADLKEKQVIGVKTNSGTGTVVLTNTKGNSKMKEITNSKSNKTNVKNSKSKRTSEAESSTQRKDVKGSSETDIREIVRNKWADKYMNSKSPEHPQPKKMKLEQPEQPVGSEESQNSVSDSQSEKCSEGESSNIEKPDEYKCCPVCSGRILQSEMNNHLESCLKCKIEEDTDTDNEILCESVPCPCCYKWFPESDMNNHIDECLTLNALKEEMLVS